MLKNGQVDLFIQHIIETPNKLSLIYTFDATNGRLLWVRQIYQVAD